MKWLFNIIGAIIIVVGGACAVTFNASVKLKTNRQWTNTGGTPIFIVTTYDNNKTLFVNGKTIEEYYDLPLFQGEFTQATLSFTITHKGTLSLVQEYKAKIATWSSGKIIMNWLTNHLMRFNNFNKNTRMYYKNSYINNIRWGNTLYSDFNVASDDDIYGDFQKNLGSASSALNKIVAASQHKPYPAMIGVKFHYYYHSIEDDTFSVNFTTMIPSARVLW